MEHQTSDTGIAAALDEVRARIAAAAERDGRRPEDVRLLLATKTIQPERIIEAIKAGAALIGENRVQEILAKADALAPCHPDTHLIGHLQSNKVNQVVGRVSCVQSVDSAGIADRLDRRAGEIGRPLEVFVQVNVSGEESKSGIAPTEVEALLEHLAGLQNLRFTGYMTVGLNSPEERQVRAGYEALRDLRDRHLPDFPSATELSMGMSGDYELAISCGATMVRLGSTVFGSRTR
ncbi:YggS family pyridoxal phosphate-dependent enzyme [Nakamurella silvestris]|nr:YggS family pyridoxal phosphate-dependent enzyme [Nakamurella silvestris]